MTSQTANYEECYRILELEFGATIQQVNKAWRRLSKLHHPDKHNNNNPHQYQTALERQKKINNARDMLRKWFDLYSGVTPPRSASTNSSQATGSTSDKGPKERSSQHSNNARQQQDSWSNTNYSWSHHSNQNNYNTGNNHQWYYSHTKPEPKPDTFSPPHWEPTPLQKTIKTMDGWFENKESHSDPTIAAIIAFLISILAPMYAYASAINLVFPEMVGHYPDWLSTGIFFGGIATTIYIFRWYFVETELIKLQEKKFQYISENKPEELSTNLKEIFNKHRRKASIWSFIKTEYGQTATLHFDEDVLPDMKRPRRIEIIYWITPTTGGATLDLAFRVRSPIHSFACNKIVQGILKELKSQLILLS